MRLDMDVVGHGGKGGGGGGRQAQEAKDTLISDSQVTVIDLLGEGEIVGLVDGGKSIYLNDTPILNNSNYFNFKGVSYSVRNGTQSQTPLTHDGVLGDADISTVEMFTTLGSGSGIEIKKGRDTSPEIPPPFTITDQDVTRVRVVVVLPALQKQDKSNGDILATKVSYMFEMSIDGSAYSQIGSDVEISGKTGSRYQREHIISLPERNSSVSIRMRRITPDSTSGALQNKTFLLGYGSIIDAKLNYPNSAIVGITINPDSFSSVPKRSYHVKGLKIRVPSNYNPDTRVYSGNWDGTFKIAYSNNPAWVLFDVLTSERYGLGFALKDSHINVAYLYTIGKYCDELVPTGYGAVGSTEPRFTINTVIQSQSEAYKLVADITSVFRGMSFWSGGKVTFMQDCPSEPVAVFSQANVVDGLFNYIGTSRKDRHSVVHVTWNDPGDRYKQKIEYVEDSELVNKIGIKKLETVAFGCTSRGQAHRAGKWLLYTEKYEKNIVTFKAGLDSALLLPGDIIRIFDSFRSGKRMSGRILSSGLTNVTLDAPITLTASGARLTLSLQDGSVVERVVSQGAGQYSMLSWSDVLPSHVISNSIFAVAEASLSPMTARIVSLKPDSSNQHIIEITATEHHAAKYDLIENNLAFDTPVTSTLIDGFLSNPSLSDLITSEVVYLIAPSVVSTKLIVSFSGVNCQSYEIIYRVKQFNEVGYDFSNWNVITTSNPSYDIDGLLIGNVVEVVIIGIGRNKSLSNKLNATHVMLGKSEPPARPTNLAATGGYKTIKLSWTNPLDEDLKHINIYEAGYQTSSINPAVKIAPTFIDASKVASVTGNSHSVINLSNETTLFYWVTAVDTSGNESDPNVVYEVDSNGAFVLDANGEKIEVPNLPGVFATTMSDTEALFSPELLNDPSFMASGFTFDKLGSLYKDTTIENNSYTEVVEPPTVKQDGSAIAHVLQDGGTYDNGLTDISFEWDWVGKLDKNNIPSTSDWLLALEEEEKRIDGFIVYVAQRKALAKIDLNTLKKDATVYYVPRNKRAFILFGAVANAFYTFGVQSYRVVKDITKPGKTIVNKSVIVQSLQLGNGTTVHCEHPFRPSTTIQFQGDILASIGEGVFDYIPTTDINSWSKIAGTGKPEDNATVGAPDGTYIGGAWVGEGDQKQYVGGVLAQTLKDAMVDFKSSNNMLTTAINPPTIPDSIELSPGVFDGSAIDHVTRGDGTGTVDITFEWMWNGDGDPSKSVQDQEDTIDGFLVYIRASDSNLGPAYALGKAKNIDSAKDYKRELVYAVPADRRVFIFYGQSASKHYYFGVQAYRVHKKGKIVSAIAIPKAANNEYPYNPASRIEYYGDILGTINSLRPNEVNVWSKISGTGKPSDYATTTYNQTEMPTDLTKLKKGDIWIDTNDGNKLWVFEVDDQNIGSWVPKQDTAISKALRDALDAQTSADLAKAIVDGRIRVFYKGTAPSAKSSAFGDLWIDPVNTSIIRRYNGKAWKSIEPTAISETINALSKPELRGTTKELVVMYFQKKAPASSQSVTIEVGDLWQNIDNGFTFRREESGWVDVTSLLPANEVTDYVNAYKVTLGKIETTSDMVNDIYSDSKLTPDEKRQVLQKWDIIGEEKPSILAMAESYGISTDKDAYISAFDDLSWFLNGEALWSSGVPSLIYDLTTTTDINGANLRSKFTAYESAKTTLINAITSASQTMSVALTSETLVFTYSQDGTTPSPSSSLVRATAANVSTPFYEFIVGTTSYPQNSTGEFVYTPPAVFEDMPQNVFVKVRSGSSSGDVVAQAQLPMLAMRDFNSPLYTALLYIYKRSSVLPVPPSVDVNYTFSTASLGVLNNDWSSSVPSGSNPLYVSTATASSLSDVATITSGQWTTPVILAQDGTDGKSYSVIVESTNGDEFRVGKGTQTTLKAHVFLNGLEITDTLSASQFAWRRVSRISSPPPNDDSAWNSLYQAGYKQITINVDDVDSQATFFCDITI